MRHTAPSSPLTRYPKSPARFAVFLRDDGAVKVSRGLKEQALRVRAARAALEQRLGREPTLSELAAETGMEPEGVALAESAAEPTDSLQRETGEGHSTLEGLLGDDGQEERLVERVALFDAMERLAERERMVIALRFFHGMTQQRAAQVIGVSQMQVSRLERRALEQLRAMLAAADG